MNSKAKRRAWTHAAGNDEVDPEDMPVEAAPKPALVAPEGLQVFDVGADSAGERLDRFLGGRRRRNGSLCRAPGSRR